MLTIPSTVQALFKTDGVYKNFRVHFPNGEFPDITNDNVVQESVKFTESLCSQSTFKFGLAEASVLEFQTVGIGNMYGMTIEAGIEIDCSSLSAADKTAIASGTWDGTWDSVNEMFYIPYGTFRVESCPRDHQSMAHRQVTAYSESFPNLTEYPGLPESTFTSSIFVRQSALEATVFGTGLVYQSSSQTPNSSSTTNRGETFWDADGTSYHLYMREYDAGVEPGKTLSKYVDVLSGFYYQDNTLPSFVSVEMPSYDPSAYEALGVAVAKAITDAGINITYNQNKVKIYDSNEAALRSRVPWLFYPCLRSALYDKNGNIYSSMIQKVEPGALVPVICRSDTQADVGFWCQNGTYYIGSSEFICSAKFSPGNDVRIFIGGQTLTPTLTGFLTSPATVTFYGLDTYDAPIAINSTGTQKVQYLTGSGSNSKAISCGTYINSIDYIKLLNGLLETRAQFLKTDRFGGFETLRLDDSSPISVSPGDYAECWWDEYDVDPIGTVVVNYSSEDNADNVTNITISTGASVYDMTGNEILANISGADLSTITRLIKTNFAPHTNDVAFTPTELTMQGWPWIEAGDALEITAEDATVVDTYALRIEMNGIQHLQSVITAEGGEIIAEVS